MPFKPPIGTAEHPVKFNFLMLLKIPKLIRLIKKLIKQINHVHKKID